jgi:hypothetical protein
MSESKDYAYTFQMIMPGTTTMEIDKLEKGLLEICNNTSAVFVYSRTDDFMLTLEETTEYPDHKLSYAIMIARSALDECGVKAPVFTRAIATPKGERTLCEIHVAIMNEAADERRIDLTDLMYAEELNPPS